MRVVTCVRPSLPHLFRCPCTYNGIPCGYRASVQSRGKNYTGVGLMDERHSCYAALGCKWCTASPPLSCVTDKVHGPLGWGGSCSLLTGLRRGYSVPHQGFREFEPSDFILPSGPTLFQMLERGHVVGSYHWPPESLPIFHDLLQVNGNYIPDGIRLKGND